MGPWALEYCIKVHKVQACCSAAGAENYFSFTALYCHYSTKVSLQLSTLTVLSALQGMCSVEL